VQRGRQLQHVGTDLTPEVKPVFDGAIWIGVAHATRRQLLQGGGEHTQLHELGLEITNGHGMCLLRLDAAWADYGATKLG
jgi:hypothetical protein